MVLVHGLEKTHKCKICGKTFYLKWKLNKHANKHTGSVKPCKYFQEGQVCPFIEIGCKFKHQDQEEKDDEQGADDESRDDAENNLCYFCDIMFATQGDLIAHIGNMHLDRFPHIQQDDFLMTF